MPKPNLLIVGCQKCGTTWLHHALSNHPSVFGSKTKELNYFNRADYAERLDVYLANFPEQDGVEYYMESTPHYFRGPDYPIDVARNIARTLDRPKLIVVFRNPVDRYESAYIHHMMKGRLPYVAMIDNITDDFSMLALGRYTKILMHWRNYFGADLKTMIHDDLVSDPVDFAGQALAHLELENPFSIQDLDFRTNDKNMKVRQMPESWETMPALSERVRNKLNEQYQPGIKSLADLIGRDLSHWR